MKLVERHIITKNHPMWPDIDHRAFLSKNLFNLANYHYRQHFFQHHQKLNFNQLYHQLSQTNDYKVIGHNIQWKQGINLGRKNNQQFVNIPHERLLKMLTYKAQLKGIKVIIMEESYTSQASAIDGDVLPKYGDKKPQFQGHRIARGLYKTLDNRLLNADVNGSFNIIRKVIPDVLDQGIKGLPFNPVVVDPLRMTTL